VRFDRSKAPEAGTRTLLEPVRPHRSRLDNGMGLVWVRRDRLPGVSLSLVLPAGADSVGVESAGIASLVGKLLPEGAAGRSAREMAFWIDGLGAQVGVTVGYDAMVLRVNTLSDLLEDVLDVLAAVALEPDFLPAEVERCRGERLDAIRRLRDDPADVAADVLAELMYGRHPYGRLARGRVASVERLGREDLVEFHLDRFAPGAATLVACGDLPEHFPDLVERRFGSWRGTAPAMDPPDAVSGPEMTGIVLVDHPGSRQSVIRIAGIGLHRGHPEEPSARVMNAILGGLFNSRINLNLRENKGWTYGARSTLSLRRSAGPLTMRAAVETGVTADAVKEMLGEALGLREAPPSEAEMETAAGALTRSLPLKFERNGQIAGSLADQVVYGLPDDYWTTFPGVIESVSRSDVHGIAARLLDPAQLTILVVGDKDAVRPEIEELGPVTLMDAP